ncbi:MAG: helix-turn-helix domain-containing protein [Haladaptatus sp.]
MNGIICNRSLITFYYILLHMPVDFESYHPTNLPNEDTNGRDILEFLAEQPDLGFRAGEIAEELNIPRGSVGTTLSRLESRGLVRHKGEYWAINPEAYDAHTASLIGLETVAMQFEGDYYDQNPDWDADIPDIDEQQQDGTSTEKE